MCLIWLIYDSAVPAGPVYCGTLLEVVVGVVISSALSNFWNSVSDACHRLVEVFIEGFPHAVDLCFVVNELLSDV